MYIFTYLRTEFTCVGICLRICTQGLYVYVYILHIYTQSSHVRVKNMIANIHIEFIHVCVGIYVNILTYICKLCVHIPHTHTCTLVRVYAIIYTHM